MLLAPRTLTYMLHCSVDTRAALHALASKAKQGNSGVESRPSKIDGQCLPSQLLASEPVLAVLEANKMWNTVVLVW